MKGFLSNKAEDCKVAFKATGMKAADEVSDASSKVIDSFMLSDRFVYLDLVEEGRHYFSALSIAIGLPCRVILRAYHVVDV